MPKKNTKKKSILVIEEGEAMRQALSVALKKEGYEVFLAENGEKGLDLAWQEHPDLILLDLLMPHKDGFAVLKDLRADEWGKDVPVIILTNLSGSEYVAETIQFGVFDHLVKSDWSIADVVRIVGSKLAK